MTCYVAWLEAYEIIVLKDRLIPIKILGEEAFLRLKYFKGHDFMTSSV